MKPHFQDHFQVKRLLQVLVDKPMSYSCMRDALRMDLRNIGVDPSTLVCCLVKTKY